MRKLIALLLVLGISSVASAGLQISVNGDPEPPDTAIVLGPSDTAILNIHTDDTIPSDTFIYWALVANAEEATISGGIAPPPLDDFNLYSNTIYDDARGLAYPIPDGTNGVAGTIAAYSPTVLQGGLTIFDEIEFHCEMMGETDVLLVITPDFVSFDIVDQVRIHQTPEPMTLGLLGLGGLGLLRRRRR